MQINEISKNFLPRPYQIELYERAKLNNVIVCLGTGTGKTFIAILLIKDLSHELREPYEGDGKRTIFLVPTVPLVAQQAKVITSHTNLVVGEYFGKKGVDNWKASAWEDEFRKNHVLIMTADVFKNILTHGFMPISKVNLLIFDEAHRAVKNHPYREIMRSISDCIYRPRILGLSASLINCQAKPEEIQLMIKNLESTLLAKCETAGDIRTINKHGAKPEEELFYYPSTQNVSIESSKFQIIKTLVADFVDFINDISNEFPSDIPMSINHLKKCLTTVLYIMESMGIWCAKQVADMYVAELAETVAMLTHSVPLYAGLLSGATTLLNYIKGVLESLLNQYPSIKLQLHHFSTPKLFCLLRLLDKYRPEDTDTDILKDKTSKMNNQNLCGIIFAERRAVVRVLTMWLQEHALSDPEKYGFLKIDYVLGHGAKSTSLNRMTVMSNKKQDEALCKFRKHENNLLIATSVLEEGLDVPRCNLVIRYDLPKSLREYVQSKGRARADGGKYAMLIENDPENVTKIRKMLNEFVETEKLLMEMCHGRNAPTEEEVDDNFGDQLIEPYKPFDYDGAPRVTLNSAIALVNRYCLKLPSDSFTKLAPQWNIETVSDGYYCCEIRLPINSPVRDKIKGQLMPNKHLSKKAAALEACKLLHQAKELDNNFLPIGKEGIKDFEELGLEQFEDEFERLEKGIKGQPRPGTTKRRQYYNKEIAQMLNGPPPSPGDRCYVYVFFMKLMCPIPEEQNTRGRKIIDPADCPNCFALLTSTKIPSFCGFPVFTRSGQVLVILEEIEGDFHFDKEQLDYIEQFHRFTFNDVLRLEKYPMKFNPQQSTYASFIIPVNYDSSLDNSSFAIDWDFMKKVSTYQRRGEYEIPEEERENFDFVKDLYEDAVIKPWYRQNKIQFYFYVAEICENLTPRSQFPDEGFDTFENYYLDKYKIKILNHTQPLLDVDHTSARLNLLTPRYVNRKGMTLPMSTQKTKKEKRENLQQKQILVPELCTVHPFPASLWRKAVCMPTILHRLNSLLLAEQLRQAVAKEIGVGIIDLPEGKKWPPLDFGWPLIYSPSQEEKEKDSDFVEEHNKADDWTEEVLVNVPEEESKNLIEAPIKQNETPDSSNGDDFIIDVFDPTKYPIPDEYDDEELELVNADLSALNIIGTSSGLEGAFGFNNVNSWGQPPNNQNKAQITELDENGELKRPVRIGSPSNFEDNSSNWNPSGWDRDEDENVTRVFDIGIPGLTCISAETGDLNLQGLTKDLASCQDDMWDEFDDYDSEDEFIPDEMDDEAAEFDPSYEPKKYNNQLKQTKKETFFKEVVTNGLIIPTRSPSPSDIESERLITDLCKNQENRNSETELPKIEISDDHFRCTSMEMEDIQEFEDVFDNEKQIKRDEIEQAITKLNESINECMELEKDLNKTADLSNLSEDELEDKNKLPKVPKNILVNGTSPEPNFGELLPNRDDIAKYKFNTDENSGFRVHFDPLKEDFDNSEGPSPTTILQALTMSNASDGINLERLETVGDSFLKYAVTAYLYCRCPSIHEGKLSYLRSRQISNYNLYKLGKRKKLGELMIATKFEPSDNWLPPGYVVPKGLEQALIETGTQALAYDIGALKELDWDKMSEEEIKEEVLKRKGECILSQIGSNANPCQTFKDVDKSSSSQHIPYNLLTQHSIPDKSIADCVEALIGAYLISCGPQGALLFMKWLGLKVMPDDNIDELNKNDKVWHWLPPPKSPLLFTGDNDHLKLNKLYVGASLKDFEKAIGYEFNEKAYLVQAFTHNSFYDNQVTDCYQRLEFLGDAVLDYLITRHLYEDPKKHTPGTLTDLRSALVNNTFFASLAVKYELHKYLRILSHDLFRVIYAFVEKFTSNGCSTTGDECSLFVGEGECENAEDVEVPKALGDIFESVAGAIFLDSGMSLDQVWRVYYRMMKPEIEHFSKNVPKSPIRELLEMEPQNAQFGKPELIYGRKIRVCVEVFGEGQFPGIGRNKRIAKCTAARRALRYLKAKRKNSGFQLNK